MFAKAGKTSARAFKCFPYNCWFMFAIYADDGIMLSRP